MSSRDSFNALAACALPAEALLGLLAWPFSAAAPEPTPGSLAAALNAAGPSMPRSPASAWTSASGVGLAEPESPLGRTTLSMRARFQSCSSMMRSSTVPAVVTALSHAH